MNIFTKQCPGCGGTIFGPRLYGKARGQWLGYDACGDCRALATEAGTAETPQSGSVHEGAGPQDNAQNQSPSNDIGVDKP